jgi:hypothetical protein
MFCVVVLNWKGRMTVLIIIARLSRCWQRLVPTKSAILEAGCLEMTHSVWNLNFQFLHSCCSLQRLISQRHVSSLLGELLLIKRRAHLHLLPKFVRFGCDSELEAGDALW